MSRWRETLCGSVIIKHRPSQETSEMMLGQHSEILSCGGSFIPQSQKGDFKTRKALETFFLPKQDYEVVVRDAHERLIRYGGESESFLDDFEITEEDIQNLDSKLLK